MSALTAFTRPGLRILSYRDSQGRRFTAWRHPGTSWYFTDRRSLLRWIRWSPETRTGADLRAWLNELEARDAGATKAPTKRGPVTGPHSSLSQQTATAY